MKLEKVNHNYLRYANCWEDADILLNGLDIKENDNVLSIGSAGDNSFSLLLNQPKQVVAVDINIVQLHLIELKKAAFTALNYNQFLKFLGFLACSERIDTFHKLKDILPPSSRNYWLNNMQKIDLGIIRQGKFERYFQIFRNLVLPFIHSKKKIDALLEVKDNEAQNKFYQNVWNNKRWNKLFNMFFGKTIMGRLGRDKSFLNEVKVPVSKTILHKTERHLTSSDCQNNYFLQFILLGNFLTQLPHYARRQNFQAIKNNINRLVTFKGYVEDALDKFPKFNKFNLSNIFEYMEEAVFTKCVNSLTEYAENGATFAYWNLMVPRKMSLQCNTLKYNKAKSESLSKRDNGFFYSQILIEKKWL